MLRNFVLISCFLLASVVLALEIELPSQTFEKNDGSRYLNPSWAGAALKQPNGTFNTISVSFVVPDVSGPSGTGVTFSLGFDGISCRGVGLQGGVYAFNNNGVTKYSAWGEWYPDRASWFPSDININPKDTIQMTINAPSPTSGVATITIENITRSLHSTQSLQSSHPLCLQNAEWIVGHPRGVTVANFGKVEFVDAQATGQNGQKFGPEGGLIMDIDQNGRTISSTTVSGNSITIQYI